MGEFMDWMKEHANDKFEDAPEPVKRLTATLISGELMAKTLLNMIEDSDFAMASAQYGDAEAIKFMLKPTEDMRASTALLVMFSLGAKLAVINGWIGITSE